MRPKIEKEELYDLYFIKNLTIKQLEQVYNCGDKWITRFLEKAIGDIKCVGSYLLGEPDNDWVF